MNAYEALLKVIPEDVIVFFVKKPIFICVDPSINKTCATGQTLKNEVMNLDRYVNML